MCSSFPDQEKAGPGELRVILDGGRTGGLGMALADDYTSDSTKQ